MIATARAANVARMRIDLMSGGSRPWWLRLALKVVRLRLGMVPGPVQVASYRPELMARSLRRYILRAMAGRGAWSKSEAELIAAFVSDRNACHF